MGMTLRSLKVSFYFPFKIINIEKKKIWSFQSRGFWRRRKISKAPPALVSNKKYVITYYISY